LDQPLLQLGDETTTADMAAWHQERHPRFPSERPVVVAPDWVCEVLHTDTVVLDRTTKAQAYLAAGIEHYWLLDPRARLLEAWIAVDGRWTRQGAWCPDQHANIAPFHAVSLDLSTLFRPEPDA
jgi:Uma2 family endonuclease